MKAPLRIYFDISTGQFLQRTGNFEDAWLTNYETVDEQIPKYPALSERNRETFDILELPFGAYAQDFAECTGYRVNVETKTLEFSYPDPNAPDEPPVFQKPLSEQILQLKENQVATNRAIDETSTTQQELLELLMETGVIS